MLEGMTVVVAGGAGEVGEGIVRSFLAHGATVVVPSRSAERLDALRGRLGDGGGRLRTRVADVGSPGGAEAFRAGLLEAGEEPGAVVASLGGWWQGGPLVRTEPEVWLRVLEDSLTAHFVLARALLPVLADRPGSSYTLINGGAALQPVPGAGPVSVSAAAQLMLKDVLAAEHAGRAVRINSLLLASPIRTRSRPSGRQHWPTADDVGAYSVFLAGAASVRGETILFARRDELPAEAAPDPE